MLTSSSSDANVSDRERWLREAFLEVESGSTCERGERLEASLFLEIDGSDGVVYEQIEKVVSLGKARQKGRGRGVMREGTNRNEGSRSDASRPSTC